jgi:hypothetical protein
MAEVTKAQLDHAFRMRVVLLVQQITRYASFCLIAYLGFRYTYLSVKALAGRTTSADLLLYLYGAIKAPKAIAMAVSWILTGGTAAWGYGERRAKKKVIARLHPLAKQNQAKIDPKRGSSGITRSGDTGREDL